MKKITLILLILTVFLSVLTVTVFADGLDPSDNITTVYRLWLQNGEKGFRIRATNSSSPSIPVLAIRFYNGSSWVKYEGGYLAPASYNNNWYYIYKSSDGSVNSGPNNIHWVDFSETQSFRITDGSNTTEASAELYTKGKTSAIGDGFRSALSATGETLSFITSSALLPYIGLIIGISVISMALIYIKTLLI